MCHHHGSDVSGSPLQMMSKDLCCSFLWTDWQYKTWACVIIYNIWRHQPQNVKLNFKITRPCDHPSLQSALYSLCLCVWMQLRCSLPAAPTLGSTDWKWEFSTLEIQTVGCLPRPPPLCLHTGLMHYTHTGTGTHLHAVHTITWINKPASLCGLMLSLRSDAL